MQANYQGPTHVLEHKGMWRTSCCFSSLTAYLSDSLQRAAFEAHCGTTLVPLQKGDFLWLEKRFRATFDTLPQNYGKKLRIAVKERGFRSEQAFLIAACEHELRQGDNTEAVTQFEARMAATLTNMAQQVQGLHTLAQAQVALTDVLLKYVITCVVEPPEDALPAARVRARLRYDKLIRAAAKEISNKNRDTLKAMVADE